jgi:hypothetical protein
MVEIDVDFERLQGVVGRSKKYSFELSNRIKTSLFYQIEYIIYWEARDPQ